MRCWYVMPLLVTACSSSPETPAASDGGSDTANDVVADLGADDTAVASDTGVAVDTGVGDTTPTDGGVVYGPYPAGPYGDKLGDKVANFKWRGYVNELADAVSTTKPIVDTSLDELRKKARKPWALLHVAEYF